MLKKIKNFFKWIADHTGISWILGKISSCWKSSDKTDQANSVSLSEDNGTDILQSAELDSEEKQDNLEQSHNNSTDNPANVAQPKEPEPEPVIGGICEEEGKLILSLSNIPYNKFNCTNPAKLKCVYVKCNKDVFKITIDKSLGMDESLCRFFHIKSVERQSNETKWDKVEKCTAFLVGAKLARMKTMLGLSKNKSIVHITQISKSPIEVSEIPANNSEALSSEAANIVNNNESNKLLENPSKEQLMWSKLIIPRS